MHQTVESLSTWLHRIERWTVLTGAGVSANSGIPTYRDRTGRWLRVDPIQHKEFVETETKRKRYWARSMVGWGGVDGARPNATHYALAELERAGKVDLLITQNVDRLHQKAGSQRVVDLHGRLDQVVCLNCGEQESRQSFQTRLLQANPFVTDYQHIARPDGDADVPDAYVEKTTIPECKQCSGVVMPDVVFLVAPYPEHGLILALNHYPALVGFSWSEALCRFIPAFAFVASPKSYAYPSLSSMRVKPEPMIWQPSKLSSRQ